MSAPPLTRRSFLKYGAAAGLAAAYTSSPIAAMASTLQPSAASGSLLAGAGVADVTPALGDTLFGYVRPDRLANGVAVRLWSRAIAFSDGQTKFVLVTMDLGASLDKADVVAKVTDLGYSMENVVLAATHTHAGPETWTQWLEERIAESIRRADADLGPAVAGWARGTVRDVNHNRSLSAHLANHGFDEPPYTTTVDMDPDGPDHPRDLNLRLLRVERPDGTPVAAWSNFPVHPTNFPNTNTLYSADLSGIAMLRFEDSFGRTPGSPPGVGAPLGILANGNEGDLISLYESHNPHSSADLMGLRLAEAMRELWDQAGTGLTADVPLAIRWTRIGFLGQEVAPGKAVASRAEWGYPMLGGAENGPSPMFQTGTEGTRLPAELADPVHGRKIRGYIAPWRNDPELQVVRIGKVALVPVAGEATTEAGRRITGAVLEAAPAGVEDATVVGLANDYVGYFTTPEEYEQQHYEGGHTVFGTYTTLVVIQGARDLTQAIADGAAAADPAVGSSSPYPPQGGPGTAPGAGTDQASVAAQPPCDVQRMDVVGFKWNGGPDGLDRPVDGPFVLIERQLGPDRWKAVDSDLGVGFFWSAGGQTSTWPEGAQSERNEGLHAAQWDVPVDAAPGTYRFRVTAARYELTSQSWSVTPSDGLQLLGVERDGADLVFRAQHPTPDPEVHLRYRPVSPFGGRIRFEVSGSTREAVWDGDRGGWVAAADGATDGDAVTVPAGGLVDGAGNTNGQAASLTVGDVAEAEWPADMAVGGTDRDWHGHTPGEIALASGADCDVSAPGPGGSDGGASDGGGAPDGGGATPATGGGAVVGAAGALGAAALLRRAASSSGDGSDLEVG